MTHTGHNRIAEAPATVGKPITTSCKGVIKMTGLQRTTVNKLRLSGAIKSCRIGSRRLYFVESVEAFLEKAALATGGGHDK